MNRQRSKRTALVLTGAALLTVWCGVAALGDSSTASLREQHEKEIAGKSEAERARLQRNFKAFRELPAAEQEKLRRFDGQLKEDARNGGNLRTVMNEYYDWLATLTPGQAQDLREIDDPNRREKRVRELLKEQQDQADATDSVKGGKSPPKLSSKDLAAILEVVEQALREKHLLSQDEIQQLQNKKDLAHLAFVVELAFRRQSLSPQGQLMWMSKDVMEAMLESISSTKLAAQVKQSQFPMERGQRLFQGIYAGLRAEFEKIKPEQQDLEPSFLSPTRETDPNRTEIMRLPFDQQQSQLMHMFNVKKSAEDPNAHPKPPVKPFWLRRPLGGGGMPGRPGGNLRGQGGAMRPPGAGKKNNQKDRQKLDQKTEKADKTDSE